MRANQTKTRAKTLAGIVEDFTSLFYPRYCVACHDSLIKGEDTLCTNCLADLPRTNYHLTLQNPISKRLEGRLPLAFASAFLTFRKQGIVQSLLHELKYRGKPEIGQRLGKLYGKDLRGISLHERLDFIIPVPLHAHRLRKRGYNQSAMFAQGLGESMGIPWADSISIRVQSTQTQTSKTRQERWQNVSDAFTVLPSFNLSGKRVLLVDDVITTGATLEACGSHLLSHGATSLSIACIAAA